MCFPKAEKALPQNTTPAYVAPPVSSNPTVVTTGVDAEADQQDLNIRKQRRASTGLGL